MPKSPEAISKLYFERAHEPESINDLWQGIWRVLGERIGYSYTVPVCDRTPDELARLEEQGRVVLLLPDDIYTPAGLVRLGQAFPLMKNWVTEPEPAAKITHSSYQGGCIDIEMSLEAPYRTASGYNGKELMTKMVANERAGQRISTYLVGSQLSQYLTSHHFDEHTRSRLPGSFYRHRPIGAYFMVDGSIRVYGWDVGRREPELGGRSEYKKLMPSRLRAFFNT